MTDEGAPPVDLDAAVTELYAGPPGDFVTSRQRLVKVLRAAKRRDEATEVAALNRPTLVAWAANRAALAHGDRLEALLGAGRDLVEAQTAAITKGDASTLRAARTARQRAVAALVDAAVAESSLAQAGIEKHRDELTSLFEAASLDAEAAEQLAAGRLARAPEAASGFGLLGAPDLELGPVARPEPRRSVPKGADRSGATPKRRAAAREPRGEATSSAAERRAAQAALAEAQRQAEAAEGARADLAAALAAARDAAADAAVEVSEREAALADAQQRAEAAAAAVSPAEEALARAEAGARQAGEGLEQARATAAALGE